MKSCNGFLLLRLPQYDCAASTQRLDVDVPSFVVPSDVHVKAVFSKPKPRFSCHLPPQVLRCVIHIHIDDVRLTIKSLDVDVHSCIVCFLLWEWCKTQSLIVISGIRLAVPEKKVCSIKETRAYVLSCSVSVLFGQGFRGEYNLFSMIHHQNF